MLNNFKTILKTAIPLTLGQVSQMVMLLVDTYLIGKLGPAETAGVGVASTFFYFTSFFGIGILFSLDYFVSQAFGRNDWKDCHHWLWQSFYIGIFVGVPTFMLQLSAVPFFFNLTLEPAIEVHAAAFLQSLAPSLLPFFIFIALRQYLQATGSTHIASLINIAAIGVNYGLNQCLIFGSNWNEPLGVYGSGLATTITRWLMLIGLGYFAVWRNHLQNTGLFKASLKPNFKSILQILKTGLPIGVQYCLEISSFSMTAVLLAKLGVVTSASHAIATQLGGFLYTVPIGVAGAAALLIGQAGGRGSSDHMKQIGRDSMIVVSCVMLVLSLGFIGFRLEIASLFSLDHDVRILTSKLILICCAYQIADGLQSVAAGALRGIGKTFIPFINNLVGFWMVGVPLGYFLCFKKQMGAEGFWIGLCIGILTVGILNIAYWKNQVRTQT